MPAIRRRKNLLDEKIVQAIANVAIRECKVQRPLHLPAELPVLSFKLTVRRRVAGLISIQSFNEFRIYKL
jgi:hypothetical protein